MSDGLKGAIRAYYCNAIKGYRIVKIISEPFMAKVQSLEIVIEKPCVTIAFDPDFYEIKDAVPIDELRSCKYLKHPIIDGADLWGVLNCVKQ